MQLEAMAVGFAAVMITTTVFLLLESAPVKAPGALSSDPGGLVWAVGIPRHQKVYPVEVKLIWPVAGRGRPRKRHIPDVLSTAAENILASAKWQTVSWRNGTKGRLKARFAAVRVRTSAADQGHGPAASSGGRSLTHRRTQDVGREEILSRQHAGEDESAHVSCHNQSAVDLRTGPSAVERGARA